MADATGTNPAPDSLAAKAVAYATIIAGMTKRSKQPGFTPDAWDELAQLVAVDEFVRVGRFKEVMGWREALELTDKFARIADFSVEVRRVNEVGRLVFLELHERGAVNGEAVEIDTMAVFEFDQAGKIRRLDFYQ